MNREGISLAGLGLAAMLVIAAPARAQSNDPLAPFLGVWSGVFTTQDNDYWGLEEWVCFAGCPPEVRDYMAGLLDDPANDERAFDELFGQTMGYAAAHLDPYLTPLGKRIQSENTLENDPKLSCQPYGFVREVTNPLPIEIRRDGEHILIVYEEWNLLRSIWLDGRPHPEYRTPGLIGHSVGHFEDGTLVVETARVTPDRISDFSQGGYSDELTAVERYTIRDNPRRLELEMTIEDPVTLTRPYVISKAWLYTPEVELVEDRCAERPGKF